MPTRTGLDYQAIHPDWFVCSYCYQATYDSLLTRFSGMQRKRVQIRLDDVFYTLPGEFTSVWTEPHCFPCNRRIKGYPVHFAATSYKYV